MLPPRRFLPAMHLLCAFDAAARTQSFTQAAEDLNLTQSAVSRQIKALEDQLGANLFIRERQTVRLSPAGEDYARHIQSALKTIATASLNVSTNPQGGTLNLAILPTFGTKWLAPRLPKFLAAHPEISVNLSTQTKPFDMEAHQVDAALHFGEPDWEGADHLFLMDETVSPLCAPSYTETMGDHPNPEKATLLHLESRPDAWAHWFTAQQAKMPEPGGMIFDQFATMAQAAIAGMGVALLPDFLFAEEIERGHLTQAFPHSLKSEGAYYLVWPENRGDYEPLTALRSWMTCQPSNSV